jgi:hypothetical protein
VQNKAPSAIAAPHLEQYTVSPCFLVVYQHGQEELKQNPMFNGVDGQSDVAGFS